MCPGAACTYGALCVLVRVCVLVCLFVCGCRGPVWLPCACALVFVSPTCMGSVTCAWLFVCACVRSSFYVLADVAKAIERPCKARGNAFVRQEMHLFRMFI